MGLRRHFQRFAPGNHRMSAQSDGSTIVSRVRPARGGAKVGTRRGPGGNHVVSQLSGLAIVRVR